MDGESRRPGRMSAATYLCYNIHLIFMGDEAAEEGKVESEGLKLVGVRRLDCGGEVWPSHRGRVAPFAVIGFQAIDRLRPCSESQYLDTITPETDV